MLSTFRMLPSWSKLLNKHHYLCWQCNYNVRFWALLWSSMSHGSGWSWQHVLDPHFCTMPHISVGSTLQGSLCTWSIPAVAVAIAHIHARTQQSRLFMRGQWHLCLWAVINIHPWTTVPFLDHMRRSLPSPALAIQQSRSLSSCRAPPDDLCFQLNDA